jgi:hypothetical protein
VMNKEDMTVTSPPKLDGKRGSRPRRTIARVGFFVSLPLFNPSTSRCGQS